MPSDKDDSDDDSQDEVVVMGTNKNDAKKSPLKEISNLGGAGWNLESCYSLVKIVDEKGAYCAKTGAIENTWTEVLAEYNVRTKGKKYETYRTLKNQYSKLVSESAWKDPDSEKMSDSEASLWAMLEDHRRVINEMNNKKSESSKKKDADAELARQGKEERDIASMAVINNKVQRMGGAEWTFKDGKVVAKKEDGSEFDIRMEDIEIKPNGSSGRGATAASALMEIAKARQQSDEKKYEQMRQAAELKDKADQRRHEEEMKQREQHFQLQMQQLQVQQLALFAQLSQSGIPVPPMFGNAPVPANLGALNGSIAGGGGSVSAVLNHGVATGNGNVPHGHEEESASKKRRLE